MVVKRAERIMARDSREKRQKLLGRFARQRDPIDYDFESRRPEIIANAAYQTMESMLAPPAMPPTQPRNDAQASVLNVAAANPERDNQNQSTDCK
jgi:hypothetical protein